MTSTVILNDFRSPDLWRNKYRRSTYEMWDANLHHGDVRPFACPELICNNSYESLFITNECNCGGFDFETPIVRGFCGQTYFYVGIGRLRTSNATSICIGGNNFLAGTPVPQSPPVITNSVCGDCDNTGYSYVITYVTSNNGVLLEGSPSAPSAIQSGGSTPNITVDWAAAPAIFSDYNIVATRLYRVESAFEDGTDSLPPHGSEFAFVAEFVGSGAQSYLDMIPSYSTGGPLTTYNPMTFPAPSLGTIISVARTADGVAIAETNRVFISEAGKPMFSLDGVVDVEDRIQEIVAIGNTIFVFTDNRPVKIAYQHTDGAISVERQVIQRALPLTSRKSISIHGNNVYFASHYSLYVWDTGAYGNDIGAAIMPLLTPEQWGSIDPYSVVGTAYELGYIMSSDNIDYSLMIEFSGDRTDTVNQTSVMPISYINPTTMDTDYRGHIVYSAGGSTYRWDWRRVVNVTPFNIQDHIRPGLSNQCDCCPWTIKMYFDNEGKNRFSKMRIEWDERSATHLDAIFYLHAFGNEQNVSDTLKVISSRGFSIPKFVSAQTFCVEVSGCGIMHEIRMATSNQELVSNSNNLIGNAGE